MLATALKQYTWNDRSWREEVLSTRNAFRHPFMLSCRALNLECSFPTGECKRLGVIHDESLYPESATSVSPCSSCACSFDRKIFKSGQDPQGYGPWTQVIRFDLKETHNSYRRPAELSLWLYHAESNGLGSLIGQSVPSTETKLEKNGALNSRSDYLICDSKLRKKERSNEGLTNWRWDMAEIRRQLHFRKVFSSTPANVACIAFRS